MNTKELKDKILQLAITGKLVEQNENDTPASELLKEIKLEKERLIKEKKIKKEKILPEISEEEKLFDLPIGWEWCRLGEIGIWGAGATPSRTNSEFYNGKIPWLKTGELNDGYIYSSEEFITEKALEKSSIKVNKIGSVLMAMYGATIGKVGILGIEATTNQACCACELLNGVSNKYLFYYLLSQRENFRNKSEGGAQPNISKEKITKYPFPFPPLEDQKRIVEKVEQLFSLIDELEGNKQDLLEGIKKSREKVLQLAIEGKLVEQNENDTPAKFLLEEIKVEKEKLIKEKKIKKEKSLPEISEEEKYFTLPKGWEWCRLGDTVQLNPRNKADDNLEVSFIPMALINDGYNSNHESDVALWKDIKKGFMHFGENDVVVAKITPCFENRKSAIIKNLKNKIGAGTTELYVLRSYGNTILPHFLFNIIVSNRFIDGGKNTYIGTAGQQRVKKEFIENYLIALPPVEEQKRIVAKVDELMKYFDDLETQICS